MISLDSGMRRTTITSTSLRWWMPSKLHITPVMITELVKKKREKKKEKRIKEKSEKTKQRERVSKLVFYAQSTGTVISQRGRERERIHTHQQITRRVIVAPTSCDTNYLPTFPPRQQCLLCPNLTNTQITPHFSHTQTIFLPPKSHKDTKAGFSRVRHCDNVVPLVTFPPG